MTRRLVIVSIIVISAFAIAWVLQSCQTYQPPGAGVWRDLPSG